MDLPRWGDFGTGVQRIEPLNPTLEASILQIVDAAPDGITTAKVCRALRQSPQELGSAFETLIAEGKLLGFAGSWLTPGAFSIASDRFIEALGRLHAREPMRIAFPPEEVAAEAQFKWTGKPLERLTSKLVEAGRIEQDPGGVRASDVALQLTPRQRALLDRVVSELESEPVNTPTVKQIAQLLGIPIQAITEILRLAEKSGDVVALTESVYYTPRQIENLKAQVLQISGAEPFTKTDLRDKLGTTRKYVKPLLEHFDRTGFTSGHAGSRVVRLETPGDFRPSSSEPSDVR